MKRIAGLLALVLAVSLLGASDVQGGFAGASTAKTTGPAVTATIVTDVTGEGGTPGRGLTAIRVQKAGSSAAVLFVSGIISGSSASCQDILQAGANSKFQGLMNTWVAPSSVGNALLGQYGNPNKAVITDTDDAACTTVPDGAGGGDRDVLSFTAVIQFEK